MADRIDRKLERGAKRLKQAKLLKVTTAEFKKEATKWLS